MKITFHHMGPQGENVRVDIWIDDAYAGDMTLSPDEWAQLKAAEANGEIDFELADE